MLLAQSVTKDELENAVLTTGVIIHEASLVDLILCWSSEENCWGIDLPHEEIPLKYGLFGNSAFRKKSKTALWSEQLWKENLANRMHCHAPLLPEGRAPASTRT